MLWSLQGALDGVHQEGAISALVLAANCIRRGYKDFPDLPEDIHLNALCKQSGASLKKSLDLVKTPVTKEKYRVRLLEPRMLVGDPHHLRAFRNTIAEVVSLGLSKRSMQGLFLLTCIGHGIYEQHLESFLSGFYKISEEEM